MFVVLADLKNKRFVGYNSSDSNRLKLERCPLPEDVVKKMKENGLDEDEVVFTTSNSQRLNLLWDENEVVEWEGFTGKVHRYDLNALYQEHKKNFAFISANGVYVYDKVEVSATRKYSKREREFVVTWYITPGLEIDPPKGKKEENCVIIRGDEIYESSEEDGFIRAEEIVKNEYLNVVDEELSLKFDNSSKLIPTRYTEERIPFDWDFLVKLKDKELSLSYLTLSKFNDKYYLH